MPETMNLPTNREELLAYMQHQWDAFVRASDSLPDDVWLSAKNADGWSIRDHVGHVMLWTQAELPLLTNGTPIPQNAGIPDDVWNSPDNNAVNEWFRTKLQTMSPAEIRAQRDRDFPKLVEAVSTFSDEDLQNPARVSGLEDSDRPLLLVMSENYGLHFDDHRNQIETLGDTA